MPPRRGEDACHYPRRVRIDLHTHSRVSDGTDSPDELVRAAKAAGLDVVALTDHDTADGWAEAAATAEEIGIALVRGMEISTLHQGKSVHLLGYLLDPTYEPLVEELALILAGRSARVPVMVARLQAAGIAITEADVYAQSTDAAATGRPHVADALVALGVVGHRDEAFDRFLGWGRPAYVDRYAAPLERMIELISRAGGVSVIAHPWGRTTRRTPSVAQLAAFAELGLAVPWFAEVRTVDDVEAFAADHGWPVVLKSARGGYDGRGVWMLQSAGEAEEILASGGTFLAEEHVAIDHEIAVMVARRPSGEVRACDR